MTEATTLASRDRSKGSKSKKLRRILWPFDVHENVKHLVTISYSIKERETQIQKIVDNTGFNVRIFFVAASGFAASSYSLFSTNVITPVIYYVYPPCGRLSSKASQVIDLLTLIGAIVGMFAGGHLADRAGRKRLYGLELAILIVATLGLVQASEGYIIQSTNGTYKHSMDMYAWVAWWRTLLGIGIGAEYPLSAIITSEWASTESRGRMLAGVKSMQSFARLLAVAVGLGALRHTSRRMDLQPDALQTNDKIEIEKSKLVVDQVWRLVVGIAVIPAAVAILARLTIPETPRYYVDIMKDLRKAVKNAMKVYGRTKAVKETESIDSEPARRNSDENDHWWAGAKTYLQKDPTAGRNLFLITLLWGLMDVGFYGLSMDSPSVLATLSHSHLSNSTSIISRRAEKLTCPDASDWKSDPEVTGTDIYHMLEINSIRSLLIASIASLAGSICAIIIVNRFRRRYILMVTFLILAILFGITGATLIASYRAERDHTVTIIFYAITQFFYNLGPNTMIFVLAAEIFPTVYRCTFYGIAAAGGKVGAIIIRAVIGATGNQDMSLGIRLLVFIPVMLLAALVSFFLPDVQIRPDIRDTEPATEPKFQNGHSQKTEHQVSEHNSNQIITGQQNQIDGRVDIIESAPVGNRQGGNESDDSSSDSSSTHGVERPAGSTEAKTAKPFGFFSRLQNMTLEDIAPNPILAKKKSKGSATMIRVNPADHGESRQEASTRV